MKTMDQHPLSTRDTLYALMAAIPGVVYQFKVQANGAWQFLYLSPGIETLYGVTPEAAYADPEILTRCIVPEDRPGHRAAVEYASQTRTPWFHEHRIRTPTGQRKWVRGQAMPRPQPDGGVLWYGILIDITEQKQAEAALREREARYRHLMEHLHAGVVVHAPDTRILLANTQASRLLGLRLEQMPGKTARDPAWSFVREDETPMPLDEYPVNRVRNTRQPLRNLTLGINHPDTGDRIWVLVNAFPEWDADGNLGQIVVTFIDFTERTRIEKALHESEVRLALVLRGTNDGFWDWDLVRNTLYYSPRWWAMLGYSVGELPNDPDLWRRLMHPDDVDAINRRFNTALANGTQTYEVEFRLLHKAGHDVHVLSRGFIQRNAHGQAIRVSGANTDITARKHQEELLKLSEARYSAIVEGQTDLVCRFLPDGTLTFCNNAYCHYFGHSREEILGSNFMVLVPEDDREFVKAQAGLCNAHHLTQTCEHRVLRADGEQRWIQWTDHAILDEQGALIEIQSVGRDVTENRQAEAALRALATTDELTGLANRRHFLARLVEEQARLQRQETQRAVVLMLDLDHFKTINDTFGHAAGDAVLRHGAALMRDSLRIIDQVGRIGGEEFAILLSGADRAAAQVFAERLREKFAKTPVLYEGQSIPVSVSIGITALTAQEATVNAVLRRADAALYRAKAEGRNRVVMGDDSSP